MGAAELAVITIRIDPEIHLGPLNIAWHGLTIALGGIVGGRIFYVAEHGGAVLGTRGFTFDGGVILATALIAAYVWRRRLSLRYLDAVAVGLPLGVAIGRIGDVINGEHYGPRSDFFLAVRNAHPDALTPNPHFAYQNGGLYEVLLALAILAVVWPLRNRIRTPLMLVWLVLGLFTAGRFLEFFLRSDSPQLALGLDTAQWTSLVMLAVSVAGAVLTLRHKRAIQAMANGGAGDQAPPARGKTSA